LREDAGRTGQDAGEITKKGKETAGFVRKLTEGKQARLRYDIQRKGRVRRMLA